MMPAPAAAIEFHDSWPAPARDLVLRAIERHGGWGRWSRLETVTIGLRSLWGWLPRIKGYRRTFTLPDILTVWPRQGRVAWGADRASWFDRGDMHLPGEHSPGHRRRFAALLQRQRRWRPIDALYFFGYAFASYTAVPFILPALRFEGPIAGRWRGERLAGVRVRYPAGSDVHSPRQSYLFDATGLLRRNDYVAEVVGGWAQGAHGCDDYQTIEGLPVPTRRTVVPRLGRWPTYFPVALAATFDRLAVTPAKSEVSDPR
jgi:hypothetical protein